MIEKKYGHDDAELRRYEFVRAYTDLIPKIYKSDLENKTVLKEDLREGYVPGWRFDEDNDEGAYIRENYLPIVRAVARWHAAFWENGKAFEQIGLDWRFETEENLAAHISMMKKDFAKYRANEEAGKIPKVEEGLYEGEPFRKENNIDAQKLDRFADAAERLKNEYPKVVEPRFHAGKNVTIIHGDMHAGTVHVAKSPDKRVKFDGLQAVRMGLPTEDLAMLIALHFAPDKQTAQPLLDEYYRTLSETVKDYPYETFMNDYKLAVMENMFFTIRLIERGIYDFDMRDRAIKAFESFVLEK